MSINYDATDEFGKYVVEHVRDRMVKEIADSLDGKGMHYVSPPPFDNEAQREYAYRLAVWAVASTLGEFFFMLDDYSDKFQLLMDYNGEKIDLVEASDDLTGDLLSEYGWIARFSQYIVDKECRF